MKRRTLYASTVLILGILLALLVSLTAFAQQDADGGETLLEQEKALAAESGAAAPRVASGTSSPAANHPLFVGLDDATVPAFRIDPATSQAINVFVGVEVWGAAYDYDNDQVYVSDGTDLYVWPVGSPSLTFLATVSDTLGSLVSMEGLAYYDGTLYASKVSTTGEGEGIYTVDLNTFQATRVIAYADPAQTTISGLDADPLTGQLYGTNDNSALRGLVQIDPDGTVTVITPYVGAESDVDGLAVGGGHAYLITDDQTPAYFEVWDFAAASWTTPVTSPFTTTEVFAGGAWISPAGESLTCNGAAVTFDSGVPATWITATTTGSVYWTSTDDINGCDNPYEAGGTAPGVCADSDTTNQPGNPYDTEMWSNSFDLTGQVSASLNLNYRHRQLNNSVFDVDVSTDGGATWTTLLSDTAGNPGGSAGDSLSLDLSPYVGNADVMARFRYYGDARDWYAQVDDVQVSCLEPSVPAISLNKTVGTDPAVCATGDEITVSPGTDVTYCYEVTNTGTLTLTLHDLDDTELGSILTAFPFSLSPGASAFLTVTANITQTTVNTATWTAYNAGPTDVVSDSDSATVNVVTSAAFPVCAGFEGGSLPSFMYAETTSAAPANGRVQVTTAFPNTGSFAMDIDTDCDGCGGSTLQSGTMIVDLGGETEVDLDFWVHEHGDEDNPEDGVFISDDGGTTWAQIVSLNGFPSSYTNVSLDLAAAASGVGMNLVDGFQIRFQSFDNFSIPTDGYSFDDICVKGAEPEIDVEPASLSSTQEPNSLVSQTLTIANTGSATLNWSIFEDGTTGLTFDHPFLDGSTGLLDGAGWSTAGSGPGVSATNVSSFDSTMTTITHSVDPTTITQFNSVSCNAGGLHADNAYLRAFDLDSFGLTTGFNVTEVEIGIETAASGGGTGQPLTVNLYQWDGVSAFTYANLLPGLVGTASVSVPDQTLSLYTIPVSGSVGAGQYLVVEIFTPDGQTAGHSFFIGSNAAGETGPSYIAAASCGITEPTATSAIGFPDMHIVMSVTGDVPTSAACDAPDDIPWLSVAPASGATNAGSSSDVSVTYDSTGLADGNYTGYLCVDSDDPITPQVVVPVDLNVVSEPEIDVTPTSLSAIVGANGMEDQTLTIANTGSATLNWSVFEDNTAGPLPSAFINTTATGDPAAAVDAFDPAAAVTSVAAPLTGWEMPAAVLYDNGPLVTHPGAGAGGADESRLQTGSLGMTILGFGHQVSAGNWVADDFTITDAGGWTIDSITYYAYQTGSSTTSTMTNVNWLLFDGDPSAGGSVIASGSGLDSTVWTNIYRVTETTSGDTSRPIMAQTLDLGGAYLPQGTYWLAWQTDGTLASGPWAPPVTITGQATTGNGLQSLDNGATWAPAEDAGSLTQQGLPFTIEGTVGTPVCLAPTDIPWLSVAPAAGATNAGSSSDVTVTFDATGLSMGTYTASLCVLSDDPDEPIVAIPVTLDVVEYTIYMPIIMRMP